jgi:iron complex transport system ATP-binding protein
MLSMTNLKVMQQRRILLENLNEVFMPNEICAIVGRNGAGKTTLLKTLAGLIKSEGKIRVDGEDLASLKPQERAKKLSFLPQHSSDHPYCSVNSRIAHGLMPTWGYDFLIDEKAQNLIENVASSLKINHLLHKNLAHLSGGELRLIHLAKCLVNPQVKLILLDEPSVFLDFIQQEILMECLKAQSLLGKTLIFSSHDQYFIKNLAHRILEIADLALIPHLLALGLKELQ